MMRFGPRLPNDTATLLLLAASSSSSSGSRTASATGRAAPGGDLRRGGGLPARGLRRWLWGVPAQRTGTSGAEEASHGPCSSGPASRCWPSRASAAAFVSDWFVARSTRRRALGISKAFTGLVIVGIAGTRSRTSSGSARGQGQVRPRHLGGQELGRADRRVPVPGARADLAPLRDQLTFVLSPVYIGALALMAIAIWQVTGDGEATLRGLGAGRLLRRARHARVLRVASFRSRRPRAVSSRHCARLEPVDVEPRVAAAVEAATGWPTASSMRFTWCLRPSWIASSTRPGRAGARARARSGRRRARRPARAGERSRPRLALDLGHVDLVHLVARMREPVGELAVVREQERTGRVGVEPPDRDDARLVRGRDRPRSAARAGRAPS